MRNPFESHSWWSAERPSTAWSKLPATAGVVVSTALLAGLTYAVWRALRSTHASRQGARPGGQPEDLTRWEGEGGGVPIGGGRTAASELNPAPNSATSSSPASTSLGGIGSSTDTGTGSSTTIASRGTGLQGGASGSSGGLPH